METILELTKYFLSESKIFFDYHYLAEKNWRELLKEAQKKFGMSLYFENDDDTGERIITIPQSYWDFTKCRFKCKLRLASSDWQEPVAYFRCQLVDGFAHELSKTSDKAFFIYIPGKGEGNDHLIKAKSGKWIAPDADSKNKLRPNERKAWQSLKKYLKNLVELEDKNPIR